MATMPEQQLNRKQAPQRENQRLAQSEDPSLTRLVGRSQEIEEISELLLGQDTRLLVLTGPAGVGKTRLARACAHQLESSFRDGSVFIDLAPVRQPSGLMSTIARDIGVGQSASRAVDEVLLDALRSDERLLILDNFEQIREAGPRLVELLVACPGLKMVVTSRAVLQITGEHDFPVQPLALSGPCGSSELASAEQLFVERARTVDPRFQMNAENRASVTEICARLDGLPLAIELAAARLRHLPLDALRSRLTQQLDVLSGGLRDQPDRLQTMRNAVSWSYELLDPNAQTLFRQLAVFPGGFRLDAATWITGGWSEDDTLERIAELIDTSMVHLAPEPDGEPRYKVLEVIREFGLEQLEASGEMHAIQQRMADWCVDLVVRGRWNIQRRLNDRPWLLRYDQELNNIRSALGWLESHGQAGAMLRLARSLGWYWYSRTLLNEGHDWLTRALKAPGREPIDPRDEASAMLWLGVIAAYRGESDTATKLIRTTLDQFAELGQEWEQMAARVILGFTQSHQGRYRAALEYLDEALLMLQQGNLEDPANEALTTFHIALAHLGLGDLGLAEERFSEALRIAESIEDTWGIASYSRALACVAILSGDYRRAAELLRKSLRSWMIRGTVHSQGTTELLATAGVLMAYSGSPEAGVTLMSVEQRLRKVLAAPRKYPMRTIFETGELTARNVLGEQEFRSIWQAAEDITLDEALDHVWTFEPESTPKASQPDRAGVELPDRAERLTPREQEILGLVAEGLTNRSIAEKLFITRGTVRIHVSNILGKLGASTRTEAVDMARRMGLLTSS